MSFAASLQSAQRAEVTTTPKPSVYPSLHFSALDGLRGIAILMVVAIHSSPMLGKEGIEGKIRESLGVGYLGVTLFFVLSGFLITRILIQTRENRDYFPTFFLRRSLRIFPQGDCAMMGNLGR